MILLTGDESRKALSHPSFLSTSTFFISFHLYPLVTTNYDFQRYLLLPNSQLHASSAGYAQSNSLYIMLASTPVKDYAAHRRTRDRSMSPLRSQSATMKQPTFFDQPLLTPSPHRSTGFLPHAELGGQNSTDDIFLHSPFQTPAKMHKPRQEWDEDETLVFKTVQPLHTPARQPPARPALAVKQLNATIAHPPSRVGAGTKRKTTPNATPLRPNTLTPLVVTSSKPFGPSGMSFDRLGPLPPPKFGPRTPRTGTEADASLCNHTTTFTRLKISDLNRSDDDDDSGCDISEPPTGPLFGGDHPPNQTGRTNRRLMNAKQEEVAEAVSPGGHITKRRARSRPVSDELLESVFSSPSPVVRLFFCPHTCLTSCTGTSCVWRS